MPRTARIKTPESIFHIMIKSMSDIPLFKNDLDKEKLLNLLKESQKTFKFKVYAYCLMTNHAHFVIDAFGADISKIMHQVNQCYACYFNKKYHRHGHVFMDRFKSIIVNNDNYLLTLTAYIHSNPKSMKKYRANLEKYKFSTLGIYLGFRKDPYNIVDEDFIMQLFSQNITEARKMYYELVYKCSSKKLNDIIEFNDPKTEYRSERKIIIRKYTPKDIIELIEKYTGENRKNLFIKFKKENTNARALFAFLMRCFCNYSHKDICATIGNITQGRVSMLCKIGLHLVYENIQYQGLIEKFLNQ